MRKIKQTTFPSVTILQKRVYLEVELELHIYI